MIEVACDMCDKELAFPGALIFSPPVLGTCVKYHICTECFQVLLERLGLQ